MKVAVVHSPAFYARRRFFENKASVISALFILILALAAIVAPVITPASYEEQKFLTDALAFPSETHWFGVDNLGRDLYSRIVYGARVSLGIGVVSALVSLLIGVPLGAAAGFF